MKKMEQLANVKAFLCMVFGAIAGGFVNLIGGWSEDLTTLLIFMGVDFVLGLLIAAFWKKKQQVGEWCAKQLLCVERSVQKRGVPIDRTYCISAGCHSRCRLHPYGRSTGIYSK